MLMGSRRGATRLVLPVMLMSVQGRLLASTPDAATGSVLRLARLRGRAPSRAAVLGLRRVRGGQDESLMSMEDALASGDVEESSSPGMPGHTGGQAAGLDASPESLVADPDLLFNGAPQHTRGDAAVPELSAHDGTGAETRSACAVTGNGERQYKIRPPVEDKYKGNGGDALEFQLLDVDYKKLPFQRPGTPAAADSHEGGFTIDAFGTTAQGNSVHVAIKGFLPYFFVDAAREFSDEECATFVTAINSRIARQSSSPGSSSSAGDDFTCDAVIRCSSVRRKSIWGYRRDKDDFLQIFCSSPEMLRKAGTVVRNWDVSLDLPKLFPKGPVSLHTFETNVDPITRLTTDSSIIMSGWIRIEADKIKWCDQVVSTSTQAHAEARSPGGTTATLSRASESLAGCRRTSWCDIDIAVDIADFQAIPEKEDVAPFLIGSFDIECVPEGGRGFPDATKPLDRCVQIGTAVYRFGESEPVLNVVFTLGSATVNEEEAPGLVIKEFRTEEALLMAWQQLVVHELDLDLLTGHNIYKFDLNYIARRAELLKLKGFFELGRMRGRLTSIRSTESQSKAFGHNEYHYLPMTGRMQMDIYNLITKQYKLSSYKLDSMSKHFLGDEKDDVSPKQIFQYQVKDAYHRGIVAKYCAKDCELVYRLIHRLDLLPQYLEMSKVTGVTMNDLNTRGQQIKVFTQIVREARLSDFVVPDMRSSHAGSDVQYTGAFVLPPTKGIYQEPIATLDFASLYPSIIQADNLSYETLVHDSSQLDPGVPVSKIRVEQGALWDVQVGVVQGSAHLRGATDDVQFMRMLSTIKPGHRVMLGTTKKTDPVEGEAIEVLSLDSKTATIELVSPVTSVAGQVVIKRMKVVVDHVYTYVQNVEGVLPRICKNLLNARKKARKEMALTDDPVRKGLLNGKQLALKVSCNSVYGFTGAARGMLPCLAIASSVTSIGQQMIKTTAKLCQKEFNATVVYGDTDSVMVNFHCGEGPDAVRKALELGTAAAELVSKHFKHPNELEFEKVYMPYILYSKKRYAGQMWTQPDRPDKIDIKGLQVVRRDNSQLQREILKSLIKTMVQPISAEELLEHKGISKVELMRQRIATLVKDFNAALVANKYPIENFIISQSISKRGYDMVNSAGQKSASLGHVKLAQRMEQREPGTGPVSGDRVQFVVVREAPHLAHVRNRTIDGVSYAAKDWPPRHERCEDPVFVKVNNMTIDLEYYLNNQLKNSVTSLLEPVYPNSESLFVEAERNLKSITSGNRMLTSFFSTKPRTTHGPPAPAAPDFGAAENQGRKDAAPAESTDKAAKSEGKTETACLKRIPSTAEKDKRAGYNPNGKTRPSPERSARSVTRSAPLPSAKPAKIGGSQCIENFLSKRPAGQVPLPSGHASANSGSHKKRAPDAAISPSV